MKRFLSTYTWRIGLLAAVLLATPVITARGSFYGYTDENGQRVFVDDPDKVPLKYREGTTVYDEPRDRLSESERKRLETQEAEKRRKAREDYLRHVEQINRRQAAEAAREARRKSEIQRRAMETPIIVSNDQILVPVTLAHRGIEVETHLLLDTGASVITLHDDVARLLKIEPSLRSKAKVVGGGAIRAGFIQLSYVRVGPLKVNTPLAGIIAHAGPPTAYGGFLGMNILKEANFRIDFDRKVIQWLPPPDNR